MILIIESELHGARYNYVVIWNHMSQLPSDKVDWSPYIRDLYRIRHLLALYTSVLLANAQVSGQLDY